MNDKTIKICTIRSRPDDDESEYTRPEHAAWERVDNTRIVLAEATPRHNVVKATLPVHTMWEHNKTLRVKFLGGEKVVQDKVKAIALEWEQYVNLRLQFVQSGDAEIRVSFADGPTDGSWSTVGTDSLPASASWPSMNFGWLYPNTAQREYRRVVLHEFGHALGLAHEHQNPAATGKIPWDKPKVYKYYKQQGWTKAEVDSNIFDRYDRDTTNFTTFDPTSIMEYAIPDELTVGSFSIGWNTELSDMDKQFMRTQYPQNHPGLVTLAVGAAPHTAALAVAAEVDTYRFEVTTAATYIMSTSGQSDTFLTLQGPNDPGAILSWDDDKGRGVNAKIVRKLLPGEYWLAVRHKTPVGTGNYSIGVKARG